MGVKIAKAFGVHVTVLSTSPGKKEEALNVMGADAFVVTKEEEEIKVRASFPCLLAMPCECLCFRGLRERSNASASSE